MSMGIRVPRNSGLCTEDRLAVKALRHHHLTQPLDGVQWKPKMCEGGREEVEVETLQYSFKR